MGNFGGFWETFLFEQLCYWQWYYTICHGHIGDGLDDTGKYFPVGIHLVVRGTETSKDNQPLVSVEKLVRAHTHLVLRECLDDTLCDLLPWDIEFVIDEPVDEKEKEPEVKVWIVVTQTYLICWKSRRVYARIICMQHFFGVFLHRLLWWNWSNSKEPKVCVQRKREREREKERKNREKTKFFLKNWSPAKKIKKNKLKKYPGPLTCGALVPWYQGPHLRTWETSLRDEMF